MTKNHNLSRWRHICSCCLFFLTVILNFSAQDIMVAGRITDGQLPISGASIIVKNTTNGVVSDFDGHYQIAAKTSDTLQISYLGYTTLSVAIKNRRTINVVLQEETQSLKEVVINAGYYTTTDREKTGSIARVSAEDIEIQPVNNALDALQGRMPGLDITPTTGLAGGGYSVRIRGQNSIGAGNDPLYVIDGVPYDTGSLGFSTVSGSILPRGNINPLNTLDPASIESIEVLKDADATAIYGSRGANGVILVTTKKGKVGKTTVSVNASTTMISVTKMRDLLHTDQYLKMREEAFANDGYTTFPSDAYDVNGTWSRERDVDWQKIFLGKTAINQNLNVSISGGSEQTQFSLMGSFMKETTVLPLDFNYKRTTLHTTTSHQSKDKRFTLEFSANYGIDNNYLPSTDLSTASLILAPNAPEIYDSQGNLNWENNTWDNPYAELESVYKNKSKNLTANTVLMYNVFNDWNLKTNLGYTNYNLDETKANPSTRFNPAYGVTSASSSYFVNNSQRESWIVEPQFEGKFKLGKGLVNILFGATLQEQNLKQLSFYGYGYADNQLITTISAANNVFYLDDIQTQYHYVAGYARLNYNFDSKYILNLTGRRDGSSRFGPSNQFANFGAVGAAWVVSKEKFLKDIPWLSYAKLRASYGTTGNDQIGDYQYLDTYNVTDELYDGNIGLSPARLFNPDYAWEENRKIEIGLEAGLIKDRFLLELAYYNNRSDNQLVGIPLPATTGFSSLNANLNAVVENHGWELSLHSTNIQNNDFNWKSDFQISVPKTELTEFDDLESSTYANLLQIGYPLTIYKMYHFIGVNTETGVFEFEDFNDDGMITGTNDRKYVADVSPKYFGSLNNSFQYKNWKLEFSFQFMKKKAFNEFYAAPAAGLFSNQTTSVLNHWQNPSDQAAYQLYTAGDNYDAYIAQARFSYSSGAISDASFIRLKTLGLTYKLPLNGTTKCSLFLQGQNLLTLTKFKAGDPEQQQGFLPPLKRISLGLKIEL